MKKIIIIATVALYIAACGNATDSETHTDSTTVNTQGNTTVTPGNTDNAVDTALLHKDTLGMRDSLK